ncbi:hypothetical protein Y032_0120g906 [Ancylostoma ceylanicum]|nr:hypothetical protein Y032_0120g906 [Ancylostoma ceylanicum]
MSVKMTRGQIMDTFFAPLEELKRKEKEPQWCELSEMRLFQLIIRYKPAGDQGEGRVVQRVHRWRKVAPAFKNAARRVHCYDKSALALTVGEMGPPLG